MIIAVPVEVPEFFEGNAFDVAVEDGEVDGAREAGAGGHVSGSAGRAASAMAGDGNAPDGADAAGLVTIEKVASRGIGGAWPDVDPNGISKYRGLGRKLDGTVF